MSPFQGENPLGTRILSSRAGLGIILLVTSLATAVLATLYDGTLLSNDTAQYLSVARHLQSGQGLKTDLVFFAEHLAFDSMPVEQTVFPPGFPWLIELAATSGLQIADAAFLVTASSFALIPVVIYLLGVSLRQAPTTALLTALLWLGLVDNWFITL